MPVGYWEHESVLASKMITNELKTKQTRPVTRPEWIAIQFYSILQNLRRPFHSMLVFPFLCFALFFGHFFCSILNHLSGHSHCIRSRNFGSFSLSPYRSRIFLLFASRWSFFLFRSMHAAFTFYIFISFSQLFVFRSF